MTTAAGEKANAPDPLVAAIAYEQTILDAANEAWGDEVHITPALYVTLRALARRPIPAGFIEHVPEVKGKPYASTGVKSVQVQMDRLDNVFRSFWDYTATYTENGSLCYVVAWVGPNEQEAYTTRDSYGGVDRGSTKGNVYKGSFTNAAKPAFARLGPGWEVYVGAADFDPDTDKSAAEQQGTAAPTADKDPARPLPPEKVLPLLEVVKAAGLLDDLPMKLRQCGVDAVEKLTVEQALSVHEWASKAKADAQPETETRAEAA